MKIFVVFVNILKNKILNKLSIFEIFVLFFHLPDWSEDGQLLALASMNGSIQAFLTKLPLLASVYQRRIAFMTSLKEISIYDHLSKTKVIKIKTYLTHNLKDLKIKQL